MIHLQICYRPGRQSKILRAQAAKVEEHQADIESGVLVSDLITKKTPAHIRQGLGLAIKV